MKGEIDGAKAREQRPEGTNGAKKRGKKWLWAALLAILVVAGFYYVGDRLNPEVKLPENWDGRDFTEIEVPERVMKRVNLSRSPERYPDEYSDAEYYAYYKKLQLAYAEDDFGSSTPQGTFDGFVDALEKRKIERAARYFVPEKRREMEEDFKVGSTNEGVSRLLEILNREKVKNSYDDHSVEYSILDSDGVEEFGVLLTKNKYTGVWKIESL